MDSFNPQFADPAVTRVKFEREMDRFYHAEDRWRQKGVFLIRDECPICEFLFLAPQSYPICPLFAVRLDYTNYDSAPPSLQFINPFTRALAKPSELTLNFKQKISREKAEEIKLKSDYKDGLGLTISLDGSSPFFCHPGTKEYHEHPYHTGDAWLLHRGSEGRIYRLLDILYSSSVARYEGIEAKPTINKELNLSFKQKNP